MVTAKTFVAVCVAMLASTGSALESTAAIRDAWETPCVWSRMQVVYSELGESKLTIDKRGAPYWNELYTVFAKYGYTPPRASTGAYNCRKITSGAGYSLHAYGIAADFDWNENPYQSTLKTNMPFAMVDEVKKIRTNNGHRVFRWGGDFRSKKDAMHYEIVATPAELEAGLGAYATSSAFWKDTGASSSRIHSGSYGTDSVTYNAVPPGPSPPTPAPAPRSCHSSSGVQGECIRSDTCGAPRAYEINRCPLDPPGVTCCAGAGAAAEPDVPCTSYGGTAGSCIKTSNCAYPATYVSNRCIGLPNDVKCCLGYSNAAGFEIDFSTKTATNQTVSVESDTQVGADQDDTVNANAAVAPASAFFAFAVLACAVLGQIF